MNEQDPNKDTDELTGDEIREAIAPNADHNKCDSLTPGQAQKIMLAKLGRAMVVPGQTLPAGYDQLTNQEKNDWHNLFVEGEQITRPMVARKPGDFMHNGRRDGDPTKPL
jgi:hypothetical protein